MPYKSKAQARYVHMKADEGEDWAEKFVNESKGEETKHLPDHVAAALKAAGKIKKSKKTR